MSELAHNILAHFIVAVQFIVAKLKVNYNAYMHLNFWFYNKPKYLYIDLNGDQQLNDLYEVLSLAHYNFCQWNGSS
jgi:hypothetical protein